MKILYHHRIGSKDGQFVHVEELTRALSEAGHEVFLSAPGSTSSQEFGGESGIFKRFRQYLPRGIYELLELGYSMLDYIRMSRKIKSCRPQVIYERYNLLSIASLLASKRYRIPLFLEINAPLFEERSSYSGLTFKSLARWSEQVIWKNADHIFTVTNVLRKKITDCGIPANKITVTPNGIDPEKFFNSTNMSIGRDNKSDIVLGFIGFVREWHGLERMIDMLAVDGFNNCRLLVVGDGPAKNSLEERAMRNGVSDRVIITGIVPRDEVAKYLQTFDIALQPSVVDYASPLKLFEYMAMGCAIAAPDKKNIREVLENGQNGLLFNPDNEQSFIAVVDRLCKDHTLRKFLGDNAKQTILERDYTWRANANTVVECARGYLGDKQVTDSRDSNSVNTTRTAGKNGRHP